MPELGPYGSMRGEVRENLPYRDAAAFAPPPASHGTPGGGFIRVVPCVALAQGADCHFEWHEVRRTNNPGSDGSR